MPVYEFECPKCGKMEISLSVKKRNLKKCGKCGSMLKRIYSPSGFVFLGTGFYSTDYKHK